MKKNYKSFKQGWYSSSITFIEYQLMYIDETICLITFSYTIDVYQAPVVQHIVKYIFQSEESNKFVQAYNDIFAITININILNTYTT